MSLGQGYAPANVLRGPLPAHTSTELSTSGPSRDPLLDKGEGGRLGKAVHPRVPYEGPTPLILRLGSARAAPLGPRATTRDLPLLGRLSGHSRGWIPARGREWRRGLGEGGGDFVVLPEGVQVFGYGVQAAVHGVKVEFGGADFPASL